MSTLSEPVEVLWTLEGRVDGPVTRKDVRTLVSTLRRQVAGKGQFASAPPVPMGCLSWSHLLPDHLQSQFRVISQYVLTDGECPDYTVLRADCVVKP